MVSRLSRMSRSEEGFTLIELLVVVAIIALLTAFAVPKLFDAMNDAKNARGQGDLETIPGALDRYYFDNNRFPTASAVETSLKPKYLKSTTEFINGYKQGYIYVTDALSSFYVFVDPKNSTSVHLQCGSPTVGFAVDITPTTSIYTLQQTTASASVYASQGCTATDNTSSETRRLVTN